MYDLKYPQGFGKLYDFNITGCGSMFALLYN